MRLEQSCVRFERMQSEIQENIPANDLDIFHVFACRLPGGQIPGTATENGADCNYQNCDIRKSPDTYLQVFFNLNSEPDLTDHAYAIP